MSVGVPLRPLSGMQLEHPHGPVVAPRDDRRGVPPRHERDGHVVDHVAVSAERSRGPAVPRVPDGHGPVRVRADHEGERAVEETEEKIKKLASSDLLVRVM